MTEESTVSFPVTGTCRNRTGVTWFCRSEEHTSELQSQSNLVCRLLLEKKKRRSREGVHWVLAYAWHPLLATEVAGSGHIDIVGALLLVGAVAALGRPRRTGAAPAYWLAGAGKMLPLVPLPLSWEQVRVREGALA